ncbi:iron-sulfur cluster assembly accessory protein [Sphingopyxis sp. JAI128]|nr:iron-sulfur cluster assembly accessory protein [Sphingopyxis sp. JAI128]
MPGRPFLLQPTPYLDAMATQLSDIALSPAAAARVRWIADRKGEADAALRLAVDGGGCSGFTYRFGLADSIDPDDIVTETDGVKLVVDSVSIDLVRGCIVDFVDSLGGSSFKVENPNAASGCGCGSSFSI